MISLSPLAGCGDGRPARVPIAGTVVIDGVPLTQGYVRFVSEKGRPSMGTIGPEGRFTLACFDDDDGAILGRHAVEVNAVESLSPTQARWNAPKKYANYRTSGLTQEVRGAATDVRIELTWDGGKPFLETVIPGEGMGEFHRGGNASAE